MKMFKNIRLKNNKHIEYELHYKNVKNINLRIKSNGKIYVSANHAVSEKFIEDFIFSKSEFISKALEKYSQMSLKTQEKVFSETEIYSIITELCEKIYPYYEKKGIKYPQIKFRKMTSRWGSCHPYKGILTFNINLMYVPLECIEYVVFHEFTHFLQPNHSSKFYAELEKVCPNYKNLQERLKRVYVK